MKFKGTKGKWVLTPDNISIVNESFYKELEKYSKSGIYKGYKSEKKLHISCCLFTPEDKNKRFSLTNEDENKYNRQLIAHAPEILEALIKCKNTLENVYDFDVTDINNLIERATTL